MQLSRRLKAVVGLVTAGNRVADIGCDHAYISISLIKQKIATNVIAMDINQGPLERAKANIEHFGYSKLIQTRLSDGAHQLKPGEVDTILIAGMGGALMVKILKESIEQVEAAEELVLQPQSEIKAVRQYIHQIGYAIVEENMLFEDGKYYVMIKARKGREEYDKQMYYLCGKLLIQDKNPVLKEFLEHERRKILVILKRLKKSPTNEYEVRIKQLTKKAMLMKEGLDCYEERQTNSI